MGNKEVLSNQNRIKQLRLEQHKTQKEVGEAVGLSDRAIAHYEKGIREPKLETWIKLANFFGVPVSYIQGVSNNKNTYEFKNAVQLKNALEKGMNIKSGKNLKIGELTIESIENKKEADQNFVKNDLPVVLSSAGLKMLVSAYASIKDKPTYQNSVEELNTFLVCLVLFITGGINEQQLQQTLLDFINAFKADEQGNKLDED